MQQVGVTPDGEVVVEGVFHLYDTVGLPLSVVVSELRRRGLVMSVPHFITEAQQAGWKERTIRSRLTEAFEDVYGPRATKEINELWVELVSHGEERAL
jgi:hypothetical protein